MHRDLLNELEATAGQVIAPELERAGASSCYVVSTAETRDKYSEFCLGSTHPGMSHWFEPVITPDRWAGHGPCVVLNLDAIGKQANAGLGKFRHLAAAVFCHELTHRLLHRVLFSPHDVAADPDRVLFEKLATRSQAKLKGKEHAAAVVESTHPRRFQRLVLHVAERVRQRGHVVPVQALMSWPHYARQTGWYMEGRLADEIEALIDCPLSAIARLPELTDF